MFRFLAIYFLIFIGVTATHPIYSATHHDWRLAGELEVGEKVLTYHGEATVAKTEKKTGSEAVYNLEVKDLHNFLDGESGVVVHNNCKDWISKLSYDWVKKGAHFNLNFIIMLQFFKILSLRYKP